MDNNTPNQMGGGMGSPMPQSPMPNTSPISPVQPKPMMPAPQKKTGVGSIIATVVIIVLIVIGGLYFWGERMKLEQQNQQAIQSAGTTTDLAASAQAEAAQTETVSQDDSVNTLQSEVQATQTSNVNAGL